MTITDTIRNTHNASATTPGYLPFRFAAGHTSMHWVLTTDERLGMEDLLVETLRGYATAFPRTCAIDSAYEYQDFVAALTEVADGDSPTVWTARLTYLLHMYADYIPSPGCTFVDVGSPDFHGWQDINGPVVIDVLTTITFNEMANTADARSVVLATRNGRHEFGDRFTGVRLIVLDSPFESTWNPVDAEPQPLLASDISPVLSDLQFEGGDFR